MHIPDGYLDPFTASLTYILLILYLIKALRKVRGELHAWIPKISLLSACIFAAQMINWPLPGGTSLHFVGGALAGIVLGPWMGFLTIFIVLMIQTLVFHDGGITTLGANALNMAIIDVVVGYAIYRSMRRMPGIKGSWIGAFLAGWLGITLAGLAAGIEIGYSPGFPYGMLITVPVMVGWHALLGLIEGFATSFALSYIRSKAPELVVIER